LSIRVFEPSSLTVTFRGLKQKAHMMESPASSPPSRGVSAEHKGQGSSDIVFSTLPLPWWERIEERGISYHPPLCPLPSREGCKYIIQCLMF